MFVPRGIPHVASDVEPLAARAVTMDALSFGSKDAKIGNCIGKIFHQHQEISNLSRRVLELTLKTEDAVFETKKINALLDRCSEASHALWNKNQRKEQRIAQLKERLQDLKAKAQMLKQDNAEMSKPASLVASSFRLL